MNDNPTNAEAYKNRGDAYVLDEGNYDIAIAEYTQAIQLAPDYVEAYSNRANVYLKKGEFQKAISDCTKAIEISPNKSEEPYYNRGLAYKNIGETAKAFDDYSKVIEISPENAEAYLKRGAINEQLGNIQEAIHDLEEFIRLDPGNKNVKLVKNGLKQLKSGAESSSTSPDNYEVASLKKKIWTILIGAIIGNGVTTIGERAFFGCNPNRITICTNVTFDPLAFGHHVNAHTGSNGISYTDHDEDKGFVKAYQNDGRHAGTYIYVSHYGWRTDDKKGREEEKKYDITFTVLAILGVIVGIGLTVLGLYSLQFDEKTQQESIQGSNRAVGNYSPGIGFRLRF